MKKVGISRRLLAVFYTRWCLFQSLHFQHPLKEQIPSYLKVSHLVIFVDKWDGNLPETSSYFSFRAGLQIGEVEKFCVCEFMDLS